MQTDIRLRVVDVLERPIFAKAKVIAGKNGLQRKLRWVHVLEVSNFESLIHGEEMILSTGVGLHMSVSSKIAFLEKLIRHDVSCLCLELGQYFSSVPDEMIKLADEHDFPLIVFHETVRFVDITHDIHSLIISRHHKMLEELENIAKDFHRLTLTSQGTHHILKLLHKSTKAQVVYLPVLGNPQCTPVLSEDKLRGIMEIINKQKRNQHQLQTIQSPYQLPDSNKTLLLQPVGAMGQIWAYLGLVLKTREPAEFDLLVLDRAALALAQDMLRKKYMEEHKLHSENLWVGDVINSRLKNEEQIRNLLGPRLKEAKHLTCRVCLIELPDLPGTQGSQATEDETEAVQYHFALMVRSVFEKHAFHPFMTAKNNQLIVIVVNLTQDGAEKKRMQDVLNTLQFTYKKNKQASPLPFQLGVGRAYSNLVDSYLSYQEARDVMRIGNSCGPFYEDTGIFRLLFSLENVEALYSFVEDYLGPLLKYDQKKGGELVHTLKIYLDHHGSKNVAAHKLFVTRQALYNRLEKIRELLGDDFMSPDRRLSIEVALRAHQMISKM